jgi:hypothetical protein
MPIVLFKVNDHWDDCQDSFKDVAQCEREQVLSINEGKTPILTQRAQRFSQRTQNM